MLFLRGACWGVTLEGDTELEVCHMPVAARDTLEGGLCARLGVRAKVLLKDLLKLLLNAATTDDMDTLLTSSSLAAARTRTPSIVIGRLLASASQQCSALDA